MPKSWTRRERKEHVGERYLERRKIFYVLLMLLIMFMLLVYGIIYALQIGNTTLAGIMGIILIVAVPVGIFLIDMVTWEYS